MSKIYTRHTLTISVLFFLLYHLFTLSASPIPWYDEVIFASITESFNNFNTFHLPAAPDLAKGKEVFAYGPIYFWLCSLMTKVFGFGATSFRLTNLLFVFGSFFLLNYLLNRKFKLPKIFLILISFILLTDPIFSSNVHSGRMEGVAMFFYLGSLIFLLRNKDFNSLTQKSILLTAASAAAAVFALLTTPRIAALIIPLAFLLLIRFINHKNSATFIQGLIWALVVAIIYLIWIYSAFGSINEMLAYYSGVDGNYTGFSFRIPFYETPLAVLMIVSIIGLIYSKRKTFFNDELILTATLSIVSFHLIVKVVSVLYFFFVIPFYLIIIAAFLKEDTFKISDKLKNRALTAVLASNVFIFILKSSVLFMDWEKRNPKTISEFVKKSIPPGNDVAGNTYFYYAVRENQSDFYIIDLYDSEINEPFFGSEVANEDFEYLLLHRNDGLIDYLKEDKFILTDSLVFDNSPNPILSLIPLPITGTYDANLYKIKKEYE